ncbi:hypothetical protein BV20DRAFT_965678 [Pilatotrama ljubarskyi]|nr:hypothetical protein BV20DRAFT_965678 [Pilatotrama ljubarskyi]
MTGPRQTPAATPGMRSRTPVMPSAVTMPTPSTSARPPQAQPAPPSQRMEEIELRTPRPDQRAFGP